MGSPKVSKNKRALRDYSIRKSMLIIHPSKKISKKKNDSTLPIKESSMAQTPLQKIEIEETHLTQEKLFSDRKHRTK